MTYYRWRWGGLVLLLCVTVSAAAPGWVTVRQCAADPIATPEGFTFPGVIVSIVPDDGVRALRAETMRTYYIAFAGENFIEGGALSPDGAWYAVPAGYIETAATDDIRYKVNELRVYSTAANPKLTARLGWRATLQYGALTPMQWQDAQTLLFPDGSFLDDAALQVIQPFSGEIQPSTLAKFTHLAPDGLRGFMPMSDGLTLLDTQTEQALAPFTPSPASVTAFRWSPDSAQFVALRETEDARWLALYDRDGVLIADVYDLTRERVLWNLRWSLDGTHFAFSAYDPYRNENSMYVVDVAEQRVSDPCVLLVNRHDGVGVYGAVWSPDGTQMALLTTQSIEDPNALQLLDLASGTRYGLGVYSGGLLGWGAG
ncbi:MAG: hypothetical protein H7Y11_13560 [Armatimonadetes bacterium]|nr:hypothetical protein [Anaerolineae bacterium]